jgi:hypothetical protein
MIQPFHLPQYSPGELGKVAMHSAHVLARLGWTCFFQQHFHHQYSSIPPVYHKPHLAAPFMACLAHHGVPAFSSAPPCTMTQQDAAMHRRPHPSAPCHHATFLLEDMFNYYHTHPCTVIHGSKSHPREWCPKR